MCSAFLHTSRDHLRLLDMAMGCGPLPHQTAKAIPCQKPFPPLAKPPSLAFMSPHFSFRYTTHLNAYQVPLPPHLPATPRFSCNKDLTTSSVFASFMHFTITKFIFASSNPLKITSCLEAILAEPTGSFFALSIH